MTTLTKATKEEAIKLGVNCYETIEISFPEQRYDIDGYRDCDEEDYTVGKLIEFLKKYESNPKKGVCFCDACIVIYEEVEKSEEVVRKEVERKIKANASYKKQKVKALEKKKIQAAKNIERLEKKIEAAKKIISGAK